MIDFFILIHNNTFCAEYQIKTIRKFCEDAYNIILIDSNCGEYEDKSKELQLLCNKENIELLKLPNELRLPNVHVSTTIGTKLTFVYYNYVKPRNSEYFAFLDQDMFMFK